MNLVAGARCRENGVGVTEPTRLLSPL
jgi:hypothetical protein